VSDEAAVRSALAAWRLHEPIEIEPILGGFNSHTWRIACGADLFVAKLDAHIATFEAGLAVAELLERRGFCAGAPVRTSAGALTVRVQGGALALLRFVRGEPIDPGCAGDLWIWGETMGQVHTLLRSAPSIPDGLPRWPWTWLDPAAGYLAVEPWVRPAVERALDEVRQLEATRPLTLGLVHGDAASALVDRATGERAVIDWGAAMWGPLLYDVASARWLFQFKHRRDPRHFAPFLDACRAAGPLPAVELDALDVFVRLRCAVQALYFSWRIADNIRTGLADPAENQRGLDIARMAWEQLGAGNRMFDSYFADDRRSTIDDERSSIVDRHKLDRMCDRSALAHSISLTFRGDRCDNSS
jgi:Ser/Thr protein kinase RdoA (MazF antagonist)